MILGLSVFFAVACVLLGGLLLSGLSVMQGNRARERRRRRFADVNAAHGQRRDVDMSVSIVRPDVDPQSLLTRLAALFGISVARRHVSPLPMPAVIGLSFVVALALAWFAGSLVGPLGLTLALPAWPILCRLALGFLERRHAFVLFKQFPDALSMIVRGVRVGIPVADTVRAVGNEISEPTAGEFRRLADELAIGVSLEDALRNLAIRNNLQEYRFFATAIALQSQTGGRLSETLDNLADVIRKRVAARARGFALAAEARMSALVLSALPVVTFAALSVINPKYISFFFEDQTGHLVLGVAIGMILTGRTVMKLLISRALS